MPVLVRSRLRHKLIFLPRIQVLAQKILAASGVPAAELSLDLVGDHRIRRLNRQYRGRDYPTDVLAFPMREAAGPASSLLGDVVISLHTAARQAEACGHSLDHEVVVLLIHGTLHLCGYDHERGVREARRMRRKEQTILRRLGPLPRLVRKIVRREPPSRGFGGPPKPSDGGASGERQLSSASEFKRGNSRNPLTPNA